MTLRLCASLSCSSVMAAEKRGERSYSVHCGNAAQYPEVKAGARTIFDPHGVRLIFQLAPLVVKELAEANASDWLWQIQSGSGQIQ